MLKSYPVAKPNPPKISVPKKVPVSSKVKATASPEDYGSDEMNDLSGYFDDDFEEEVKKAPTPVEELVWEAFYVHLFWCSNLVLFFPKRWIDPRSLAMTQEKK